MTLDQRTLFDEVPAPMVAAVKAAATLIDIAAGQTLITSNGGGNPEPIETLFERLAVEPLDPVFEEYGDFIEADPESSGGGQLYPDGTVSFFGNFHNYSHVFSIASRDAVLIERLSTAIQANKSTPAYAAAKIEVVERARLKAEAQAKRDAERLAERKRLAAIAA